MNGKIGMLRMAALLAIAIGSLAGSAGTVRAAQTWQVLSLSQKPGQVVAPTALALSSVA